MSGLDFDLFGSDSVFDFPRMPEGRIDVEDLAWRHAQQTVEDAQESWRRANGVSDKAFDSWQRAIEKHRGLNARERRLDERERLLEARERAVADKRSRYIPVHVRRAVMLRDGYACKYCGTTEELCLDHVYPFSLGGTSDSENLQTLCRKCNSRKHAKVDYAPVVVP